MSKLNTDLLRRLRADIDEALAAVAKKHDLLLKTGKCTFDPNLGNFTFKLEGVAKGGTDKGGAMYESLRQFHPKLPTLHSSFIYNGKAHEIVGANTTGTKVFTSCGDKGYQFPVDAVERLCAK